MALEERGIPAGVFVSEAFLDLASAVSRAQGGGRVRTIAIPHPFSSLTRAEAVAAADRVWTRTAEILLADPGGEAAGLGEIGPDIISVSGPTLWEATHREFSARLWSEGFPVIPPTPEAVEAFMGAAGLDPSRELGSMPPANGRITVRALAVNALMAGCEPDQFGVVVAAVEAMLDPAFDLLGVQATTNPATPMLVVNGPVVARLGLNSGYGLFGPGPGPNAVIGRAIRLILQNVGGALPGETDRSTLGTPAKYSFCFAENETRTPWEPLHRSRGFGSQESVVTVFAAAGPHNVIDPGSVNGADLLDALGQAAAAIGNNNLYWGGEMAVIISPEHAETIARDGYDRRSVQAALYEAARVSPDRFSPLTLEVIAKWRSRWWAEQGGQPQTITAVDRPADFTVICAGGDGRHSAVVPIFAGIRSISRVI